MNKLEIETIESRTRKMKQYFEKYYKDAAKHVSLNKNILNSMSLFEAMAIHYLTMGDKHFQTGSYLLAVDTYLDAVTAPAFWPEIYYRLGLCVQNSYYIDLIKGTGIKELPCYQLHHGQTLSKEDLSAMFFREVLAMTSHFDDKDFAFDGQTPKPEFCLAIYQLAVCISEGATIRERDLLNTPYAGVPLESIKPKQLEIALLQRVLRLDPKHKAAKDRLDLIHAQASQNMAAEFMAAESKNDKTEPWPFGSKSNGQVYKILCNQNMFLTKKATREAFKLAHELSRDEYQKYAIEQMQPKF